MNFPMPATDYRAFHAELANAPAPFRFQRPGQRPLVFHGSNLAMAMSFTPDLPFWYEINIYRTESQQFALVVKLFYQAEDEKDTVKSWLFDSLPAVFDALETYDASQDIRVSFAQPKEAIPAELAAMALDLRTRIASYRSHWASLIGELFAEMDAAGQLS